MSRSEKSDEVIRALGATPMRASLGEIRTEQLTGFDVVIHCAAYVEEWGPWSEYWKVNVDGTRELLVAAKGADVARFIHIGTEAALFHGQHMRDVDEHYPLSLDSPFPYARTKAHAEKAVREANDEDAGFHTIVLRPRFVWGEGDQTILPVMLEMVKKGQFAWIDGGKARTSTTNIANLVHAMNLALTRGRGGEAYFVLDGEPVVFREFASQMLKAAGVQPPLRDMPGWLVRSIAWTTETLWRVLGITSKPPLTRFTANIMSRDCTLVDAKARADLDYRPVITREEGLKALARATGTPG